MMKKIQDILGIKNFYSTSANNKTGIDWPEVIGRRGPLLPANRLANQYINKAKLITAEKVNKVLAFADIKITQSKLDEILSGPRLEFSNLDSDTTRSDYFLQNIGTVRGKIQVPGVYVWTHLSTGDKYVGSSSTLARRLIGYFNGTHKNTGKLIPLIKSEGVGAFKLQVIPLIESYTVNLELSLEQYFLLHSEFNLNTLKVVNNFSGARAKPLFMYTKDLSELIYSSYIQEDFIFKLRIHHSIFSKSLKTGAYYLDKYVFTDKPLVGVRETGMSVTDVCIMLDKDRLEIQKTKGRKVYIKAVDDNNTKLFDSIGTCVKYLNTIAPSNKTTLYRHINSGKPYQGYICQWESEGTTPVTDNSVQVKVTHIPTGKTETFPSYRKAALSFAPKYITTGSTIKVFAENGELFKGEYRITI